MYVSLTNCLFVTCHCTTAKSCSCSKGPMFSSEHHFTVVVANDAKLAEKRMREVLDEVRNNGWTRLRLAAKVSETVWVISEGNRDYSLYGHEIDLAFGELATSHAQMIKWLKEGRRIQQLKLRIKTAPKEKLKIKPKVKK